MGFRGQPKTKEQLKAQAEARAARKAGQKLPEVKLAAEDLEPKEGLVEKIKRKRAAKRTKKAKKELSDEVEDASPSGEEEG